MNIMQVLARTLDPTIKRGIWAVQRGHSRGCDTASAPHLAVRVDVKPHADEEAGYVYLREAVYLDPDWHSFPDFLAALKDRCRAHTVAVKTEDAGTIADLRKAGFAAVPAYYQKDIKLIVPTGYDAHLVALVTPLAKAATALGLLKEEGGVVYL
ncbi:hypothetical protein G6L97_04255 [Agrobacterium tumefaciens]|uniref:hypothetical protein n=1 Tax=Agrobacterium tumefaciens TaxID=358 RepID=UPI0012300F1C|nr:hypothetical protein [Agrobacterium tumefaciens]KAA3531420.1 hypothetical protein DXM29_05540 [Agrobacterium tumefaciens]NSZ83623.1 hypothetical protein [Agrobacterium tumefaciens]WCA69832.1 hypothetical protein G6L97_04255 [Agrobacterium tumefaciens]